MNERRDRDGVDMAEVEKLVREARKLDVPVVVSSDRFSPAMRRALHEENSRQATADVTTHNVPPAVEERMDKLPPLGLLRAARAMGHGMEQGYEDDEGWAHWRTQDAAYHLNRALRHIALHLSGDTAEDHVGHAISRMLMWGDMVE